MSTTYQDLIKNLRKTQTEISAGDVHRLIQEKSSLKVIDVRESDEWSEGHVPGAIHIPRGFIEQRIESIITEREGAIVLYCAVGHRSLFAASTLQEMGYENVRSMEGGFSRWSAQNLPVEKSDILSRSERLRYARQIMIPEIGEAGQSRIHSAKILLIGAGGLGSPAALYLTAAGVGTLGIVDADQVEESNLQRQILHATSRVGIPKVVSASRTLTDLNPHVKIRTFEERLTSGNVDRIFSDFDIVVDGTDNFATRYLINDACVQKKIPCIHGSVYRFDGQVTIFDSRLKGPCYRCLFPEPPPSELAPSCAEAGVLGVIPGIIGLLQAVEAIKLILEVGKSLAGRLVVYDGLTASFNEYQFSRDVGCMTCGDQQPFRESVVYDYHCRNAP